MWTNFKIHFRNAHHQLRETTSLQQQQSTFQANAVKEILTELRNELKHPTTEDQSLAPSATSIIEVTDDTSSTISALKSEVSSLKEMIHHMAQPPPQDNTQYPQAWIPPPNQFMQYPMYCHQVATPHNAPPPPNGQPRTKKRRIFYCWTHGACLHSSDRCLHRAPGHQPNATFKNRMGGSEKNVRLPAQVPIPAAN